MERDVREIIKRNREALGHQNTLFNDMVIDALVMVNDVVGIGILSQPDHDPIVLADGLIVEYVQ